MINIFIITAEHHFIQVEQALIYFKIDINKVLIWFLKTDDSLWINRIILEKNIKNHIISDSWVFSELKNKSPKITQYLQKLYEVKGQYPVIKLFYSQYSSDFSLLAINILKPVDVVLMDEGTASFGVCQKRKKWFNSVNIKLLLKSSYYRKHLFFPKKITLFTQYDLNYKKSDLSIKYKFSKKDNRLEFTESQVAILGSSMSEVGLLDEEYYLDLLKDIKVKYNEKELLYFSHRKESADKKNKIHQLGFEVISNEIPFEFYFEKLTNCPGIIVSFFSPTLLNLESKFHTIPKFIIFKFDINKLQYNKNVVAEIYKSYEGNDNLIIEKL